jgi:F5/8 type C domain
MDLGVVKNITRISTQGRPHSTEYVTEYSISYGYNGLDYADYKEPGGNTKVMKNDEKITTTNRRRNILVFVRLLTQSLRVQTLIITS